MRGRVA